MDVIFQLNSGTMVGIGTVLGALCGAITYLLKALITSKDETAATLKGQVNDITEDRDYWRNYSLSLIEPADKALTLAERQVKRHGRA